MTEILNKLQTALSKLNCYGLVRTKVRSASKVEAPMGVFDFGGFAVEDDAEGIEGIVGGEGVAGAEDGIEQFFFGEGLFGEDLVDGFFEGEFVADAAGWGVGSIIAHGAGDAHRVEGCVDILEAFEKGLAFGEDGIVKGQELRYGRAIHDWKSIIRLARPMEMESLRSGSGNALSAMRQSNDGMENMTPPACKRILVRSETDPATPADLSP